MRGGCSCKTQKTSIWRVCLLCCPTPPMPIVLNGRRALLGVDVSYFEDREFCRNQGILLHQLISLIRGSSFDPEESSEFSLIDSYLIRSEFKRLEAWLFRLVFGEYVFCVVQLHLCRSYSMAVGPIEE